MAKKRASDLTVARARILEVAASEAIEALLRTTALHWQKSSESIEKALGYPGIDAQLTYFAIRRLEVLADEERTRRERL